MSGFLANLAGLALGQPSASAARLSLPPRFSGGGQIDADTGPEQVETTSATPATRSPPAAPVVQAEIQRQMFPTPIVEAAQMPSSQSREGPAPRKTLQAKGPTETSSSFEHKLEGHLAPAPLYPIEQTEVVRPKIEAVASNQPSRVQRTEKIVRHVHQDSPRPQTSPLGQAALANRTVVEREPRPVVNVIIDRIEVRARREAQQSQASRRAKPQPSVSLADYLGARS